MLLKKRKNILNYFKEKDYNFKFKLFFGILIIAFCVLIDNFSKIYAMDHLKAEAGKEINFLPGFINIQYIENKGSAFGFNSNNLVASITLALLNTIIAFIFYLLVYEKTYIISISILLGGAFGNLFNRIWNNGAVIDFLFWKLFKPYSIFNIADFFVTFGIIILILSIFIEEFLKDQLYNKKHFLE